MTVYMLRDPETDRIALQTHEPDDGSRPLGLRGRDWEIRRGEIPEEAWRALLSASLSPAEQTALHREAWSRGTPA